ncbi:MAG: hypothetical protein QOF89_2098 [Acidobacteriota bacterium]|jgi:tetratricopeptide (TPR) repeat protein|nr:hypothetical protein [Acidobacteriota bacterium]
MLQLRIRQHAVAEDRHRVEIDLTGDGAPRAASSTFDFRLSPQDEEDLRWYLEDFLQYPQEPAPAIAKRIEGLMSEVGTKLFAGVFQVNDDARDVWSRVRERLGETRIEILTGVTEAATIPWELLREPKTTAALALSAHSFVRAQPNTALAPHLPARKKGKIRILLVICRPRGEDDVPFRSVASQLIKGLSEANREAYDLDVLRPPTFEQLGKVLRQAHREGQPYHVVHFDGHGVYGEKPHIRQGRHGYLEFESPWLGSKVEFVDGAAVGQLLKEAQAPVLVLNACRSAHAEPIAQPGSSATDPHSQMRAFGSLAQEVMDAGVAGVVAMRYNVFVDTAAQLVAELYASLGQGSTLGEAVTTARRKLHDNPLREIAFSPLPLQDWTVPVVYEATPLQLFPKSKNDDRLKIQIAVGATATATGSLDSDLPPPPEAGFFGRDETLLALDRAFNWNSIVLLHAYAGSGKTTTAAEFARWYSLTGGVDGPVLFTTFERYYSLPRVLDRIGQVFGEFLERTGIHWLALGEAVRRQEALKILARVPVLWIWDNLEPIAGFPAGTESAWSAAEQEELINFLRALRGTKAKVLLTSRRDEQPWLGDLPTRITVPPMPMTDSLQLVRALADKRGQRLTDVENWRPLLAFAQGNPMTLTVIARQALREGFKTKEQIEAFVARLRSGEAAFPDEASEERSRSLGASLAYGFEQAFDEEERKKLALLHMFQGFVNLGVLLTMGDSALPWCLPEVRGLTPKDGTALLDRAAEVGLMTARGVGYYSIHPVLPWFFKSLFERFYPAEDLAAVRAFVEAMGNLGAYFAQEYSGGDRDVLGTLKAEEANLLHARRLARAHGWWHPVILTMQGLDHLYDHTARRAEWKRLVEELLPDFIDPKNEGPLPGREEYWSVMTGYRVRLAREELQWAEAERLQIICVDWDRRRAAHALTRPVEELSAEERNALRTLAVSLEGLGLIRRDLKQADCVLAYEQAFELSERIGDQAEAAICAHQLGRIFIVLPALRDLDKAERWYRRSFNLFDERDRLRRGECLNELGNIALERFREARATAQPQAELIRHLNEALRLSQEALELLPPDAVTSLAVAHNLLGIIHSNAQGYLDITVQHYREAVRLFEEAGDRHRAAGSRFNIAMAFARAGRRTNALEYAAAALRGFESYGPGAAEDVEKTRGLIAEIRGM